MDYGILVWVAGVGMRPFTRALCEKIGKAWVHLVQIRNRITDYHRLTIQNDPKHSKTITINHPEYLTPHHSTYLQIQMPGKRADRSTRVLPACFQVVEQSWQIMATGSAHLALTYLRGKFVQCSWRWNWNHLPFCCERQTLSSDMGTTGYTDQTRLVVDECLRVKGTRPGEVFNSETESMERTWKKVFWRTQNGSEFSGERVGQ